MKKNSILSFVFAFCFMQVVAQDNLNTTRVGVWPYGSGNAVACHEDLVFLSHGRVVQIYDYINPGQPQLLGEVFMDDMILAFAFDEDKAFVAGYTGFHIINISNTAQPVIISSLSIETYVNAICLDNGYAYISLYGTGIGIVDISNVQNPFMVTIYQTNQHSVDMVISNNVAWLASGYQGLTALDLSDPLTPDPILTYNESGSMRSLAITDGLLYSTNSEFGIMVFDISALPEIALLSSTHTYSLGTKLNIHGNLLAVSMLSKGFSLYNISDPVAPDSLCSFYTAWPNRNTVLKDGLAFHCHAFDFNIIDISNPDEMNLLKQIGLSDISQYVHYWGNHAFITSVSGAVMAVDVSDPQQAVKVSHLDREEGHLTIHVKDDLLFTNNFHWLKVYDISEPSEPVYLNTIVAITTITNVLKHNDLLFVADYDNLQVFDISDIYAPELLGVFAYEGINEMVAEGNRLYYVTSDDFVIVDISDPANLVQLSNIYNMSTTSLAVKDTLAYVISSIYHTIAENSLKVFNIKNPDAVSLVVGRDQGRLFESVVVEGEYLYVFERSVGLHIYDIQGVYPVLCGFYHINLSIIKVAVANDICYLPVFAGIDIVQNDLLSSSGKIFIQRDQRLHLFPNPASDMISFLLDEVKYTGTFVYEIIQINGSGVKSGKLASGQQQISLYGLPAGVYVLHLLQDGIIFKSGLFIKQ